MQEGQHAIIVTIQILISQKWIINELYPRASDGIGSVDIHKAVQPQKNE